MKELVPAQISVQDPFWSPRLEVNASRAIFHQWAMLETSGCIDNFRLLAGDKQGFREGWFFADSDAYKWLDAASRIYAQNADPRLAEGMDAFSDLLRRVQAPDGYLFTYNQLHFPGVRWQNLQIEHELYCHGHLIEAGVSHYLATGSAGLLAVARRAADLLVADFLGAPPQRTPGHEEVEIALLRLYRLTHHDPYLALARHFIEQRGRTPLFALSIYRQDAQVKVRTKAVQQQRQAYLANHPEHAAFQLPAGNFAKQPPGIEVRRVLSALSGKFFQQHAPIRRQAEPVGHAVRFAYFQAAAVMLHRLQPDATLLAASERLWERMVARRMYVTGGIGALPGIEGFGNDYELDPEYAYAETCAALGSLFWNWELALATGRACYSDLFEWQLYNAAAAGMGLDGESYLYNNPLACRGGITRQAWYAVPCCPSNLSRTWASLARYIYSAGDKALWVHQYIGSRASLDLGVPVGLVLESELPWSGQVRLRLSVDTPQEFTLYLRQPGWSPALPQIWLCSGDGRTEVFPSLDETSPSPAPGPCAQGYDPRGSRFLPICRRWRDGDSLEIAFEMPVTLRRTLPQVKGHSGRGALTRGPLVYCLESIDHPGIDIFSVCLQPESLHPEPRPDLLGGITVLCGQSTTGEPLTFIPYALWGNRGPSQMTVWVRG